VLAEKGGVEVVRLRLERWRVLQILFDSDYISWPRSIAGATPGPTWCAPDVLAGRAEPLPRERCRRWGRDLRHCYQLLFVATLEVIGRVVTV
jgi:hypothetical protein